jgi:hypothetical protein
MIKQGTVAYPSMCPGLRDNKAHAIVVLKKYETGNIVVSFVTHADYNYSASVRLTRGGCPSAFRENGGPLTDEDGVLGLIQKSKNQGQPDFACPVVAVPTSKRTYKMGTALVSLSRIIVLCGGEWKWLEDKMAMAKTLKRNL